MDEGNGKFNLMILCWGEGHASAIHDHADSHCFLKVLKGSLTEIKYDWPANDALITPSDIQNGVPHIGSSFEDDLEKYGDNYQALTEVGRATCNENEVCYINGNIQAKNLKEIQDTNFSYKFLDNLGLHRVENTSNTDVAVSLHLYCPPFDACQIFNQRTGIRTKCKVTFWSKFGERKTQDVVDIPEDK